MPDEQNLNSDEDQENGIVPFKDIRINLKVVKEQSTELTTETTGQWVKEKLVEKMPTLTAALFEAWEKSLIAGVDSKVMRDVAEAIGILQPKGGINILNQVNNNNSVSTSAPTGPSVESIIRKMDEERYKRRERDTIIDAEIIEDDSGKK